MNQQKRLETLCSKIFHDLASPINGVNSGIELLSMTHGSLPEIELLKESASGMIGRLSFFRYALGIERSDDLEFEKLRKIAKASYPEQELEISQSASPYQPDMQLILLALGMIAEAKLGKTHVLIVPGSLLTLRVTPKRQTHRKIDFVGLFHDLFYEEVALRGYKADVAIDGHSVCVSVHQKTPHAA